MRKFRGEFGVTEKLHKNRRNEGRPGYMSRDVMEVKRLSETPLFFLLSMNRAWKEKSGMREESVDPKNDRDNSSVQRIGKVKMTVWD